MINPALSGLPPFLTAEGGLHSGLMIVQVSAAALASENKALAHPASVDSIPTSADKEDHVSMGTIAARKARDIVQNVENILAMELLCATQGLEFLLPLKPGKGCREAYQVVREKSRPSRATAGSARTFEKSSPLSNRASCSGRWKRKSAPCNKGRQADWKSSGKIKDAPLLFPRLLIGALQLRKGSIDAGEFGICQKA